MTIKHFSSTLTTVSLITILGACGSNGGGNVSETQTCNDTVANDLSEALIGDLSNDLSGPTAWTLGAGTNSLRTGISSQDKDYVTFTIGACDTLDSITLTNFESNGDDLAFIALQQGAVFTVPEDAASTRTDEFYGLSHFGTADINQDILPTIAGRFAGTYGDPQFTAPLQPGTYAIWLNQVGPSTEFTMVFNVSRVEPE